MGFYFIGYWGMYDLAAGIFLDDLYKKKQQKQVLINQKSKQTLSQSRRREKIHSRKPCTHIGFFRPLNSVGAIMTLICSITFTLSVVEGLRCI